MIRRGGTLKPFRLGRSACDIQNPFLRVLSNDTLR
jgi:hypothetical protein